MTADGTPSFANHPAGDGLVEFTTRVELVLIPVIQSLIESVRASYPCTSAGGVVAANEFRRDGASWSVSFAGLSTVVEHRVGMPYLATLLSCPNRTLYCQDLDGSTGSSGDNDVLLDREGMTTFASRLVELEERESRTRLSESESAERDWMLTMLRQSKGLGNRRRLAPNERERSRVRVSKAIARAASAIRERHPRLADHLHTSIERGQTLIYRPDACVKWQF